MQRLLVATIVGLAIVASYNAFAEEGKVYKAHAIAMHGQPKYGPDFKHFDYVNPNAPKGGQIVYGGFGSYDSLHTFILKGRTPSGIGLLFETLTSNSSDEAFTEYALLAETIEWPEDRSWVAFTLRPEARWHDGKPVTVDDVIWSLDALKTKGHPFYRAYYANLAKAEKVGDRKVKFTFSGPPNRELPLITGQIPILPKHYWEGRDFEATTLEPPIGSGPYKIKSLDPGRSITYELDPNYWGKDIPLNVGQNNFGLIRYDYYRDRAIEREAFKAGEIDFFAENAAKEWATGYNVPAVEKGVIVKREIRHENPQGMQAFVFNTRREIFKDRKVREAIGYAFDFEWTNKNLFYDAYTRTTSYFSNSELASSGLPGEGELEILNTFRDQIPEEVFTTAFAAPKTDGSGNIRGNIRTALRLLKGAGWEIRDGKLMHVETGTAMRFGMLLVSPGFERIVLPFTKNLEKIGIEATVNTVDTAQYQNRLDSYDFDMAIVTWGQSLSPGNEQRDFWGSEAAETNGTRNLAGIKETVIDELVDLIISAPDRESLINQTRALDRVLLWNHYVIPQWHISSYRVAYWDKFGTPEVRPKYSRGEETWWIDPELEASLEERKRALR
ncbi:MAG: extracellular solute-binding protein [Candidatus Poribacteria bacterium]|nr:extracellular solute-binding protein [Candidatus Poribacteria bacterium]